MPTRASALFLAVFAGAASAGEPVPPDPWEVIHSVRALGPAEVVRDDFRDPLIRATLDDAPALPWEVSFYGCRLGRDCVSALLTLRLWHRTWEEDPPPARSVARRIAEWNASKLVGRAWRDAGGRIVLDHAVVFGPGLPAETLASTLEAWVDAMREFAEHVDFPKE